jgi:hypothetical protein
MVRGLEEANLVPSEVVGGDHESFRALTEDAVTDD